MPSRASNPKAVPTQTSRYKIGVVTYYHKGKRITSTVGSIPFEQYTDTIAKGTYRLGRIPAGYDSRPDLVAHLFFGQTDLMWKLLLINNIPDPFEGFLVGEQILLPKE